MRIVFFGANDIGWACLNELLDKQQNIVGIYSIPQTFSISYAPQGVTNVVYRDFEILAKQHSIPFRWVTSSKTYHENFLTQLNPDLIIVIGWYYMIPAHIGCLAKKGTLLVHASLLPKYRGGAPLTWAIIQGENETGVTLFFMADGIDNGDVIGQMKFPIEIDDTIFELRNKATSATIKLLHEYIPQFQTGPMQHMPQNENEATYFPQRKPEDGLIHWEKTSLELHNWVRAQTKPLPGAFTFWQGKPLHIWHASASDAQLATEKSGSVLDIDSNNLLVACGSNSILSISQVEYEKLCYTGREFFEKFLSLNIKLSKPILGML